MSRGSFPSAVLLLAVIVACACSSPKSGPADSRTAAVPSGSPPLWGDLKPIVSVKELMRDMLDPAADYILHPGKVEFARTVTMERSPMTVADRGLNRSAP